MSETREIPVIGWQLDAQFGDKVPRVLRAQTHIPADATPEQIDALLDKVARAQDRQIGRYKLEQLRDQLEQLVELIVRYEADLVRVEETAAARWAAAGRKGDWDPAQCMSGQEKAAKKAAENTLAQTRDRARQLQQDISKMEAAYAGTVKLSADRDPGDTDRQVSGDDGASRAAA